MRVILFAKYGRAGASSRIRSFQYIPFLKKNGIDVDVSVLFEDKYIIELYQNSRRSVYYIFGRYLDRLKRIFSVKKYDLIWIEKELFPMFPAWAEWLISLKVPYVVDYDDAIFHNYDLHKNKLIRFLLGRKIDSVMKNSETVIAGNGYIEDRAKVAGAKRVVRVPSVVDLRKYKAKTDYSSGKLFKIGWIGSPATAKYLNEAIFYLEEFCVGKNCKLILIGARDGTFSGKRIEVEVKKWSEDTEAEEISRFDVGIMPLSDGPWERGKCGYKLIQYMACGVPVVGSPVGVNREIIQHGTNGFQVNAREEWIEALNKLYKSADLRKRMGVAGRRLVEDKYSLEVTAPRLVEILKSSAKNNK